MFSYTYIYKSNVYEQPKILFRNVFYIRQHKILFKDQGFTASSEVPDPVDLSPYISCVFYLD